MSTTADRYREVDAKRKGYYTGLYGDKETENPYKPATATWYAWMDGREAGLAALQAYEDAEGESDMTEATAKCKAIAIRHEAGEPSEHSQRCRRCGFVLVDYSPPSILEGVGPTPEVWWDFGEPVIIVGDKGGQPI